MICNAERPDRASMHSHTVWCPLVRLEMSSWNAVIPVMLPTTRLPRAGDHFW